MERTNVIWKVYPNDESQDENTKLEFSVYGEVKSYSVNCPQGRIINGGLQEGYPIIRFKRLAEMDEVSAAALSDFQKEVDELRAEIKVLNASLKKKSTTYDESRKIERKLFSKKEALDKLLKKLSKERAKINKKRAKYFHVLVHKAVAELFVENDQPETKKFVIHKNFDKKDNRAENLAWATKEEVVEHGLKSPKWIEHNLKLERKEKKHRDHAKLSYSDVVFIKMKLQKGEPMARLARRFGVSDMQIHRIKTGENWSDVEVSLLPKNKTKQNEISKVQN